MRAQAIELAKKAVSAAPLLMLMYNIMLMLISVGQLYVKRNREDFGDYPSIFMMQVAVAVLCYFLLKPRDVSVQVDPNTRDTDSGFNNVNQSSRFFMQLVVARRKLNHASKITIDAIDNFSWRFSRAVYNVAFPGIYMLTRQPVFCEYLFALANIYCEMQRIPLSDREPRIKDCEVQTEESYDCKLGCL